MIHLTKVTCVLGKGISIDLERVIDLLSNFMGNAAVFAFLHEPESLVYGVRVSAISIAHNLHPRAIDGTELVDHL
jgi:hypothetical protein